MLIVIIEDYKKLKEMKSKLADQKRLEMCEKKEKEDMEKKKDEMLGQLKNLGNNLLGKFGFSLDNFKMNP